MFVRAVPQATITNGIYSPYEEIKFRVCFFECDA